MAGALGRRRFSSDLRYNHENSDSESIAQEVFAQLEKNPLLTSKPLCKILELSYREHGKYVANLKTKWKYHHEKQRGSIRSLPDSVHCAFWVGVLPRDVSDALRIKAVGCGVWKPTKALNRFLLWKDRFGRVRWFENGKVELYVRKPASEGKAMQLFCRAFIHSGLVDLSNVELAKFIDGFARYLRHRGAHALYKAGQRLPYMKITTFWDSNGFMVITGDRTHPDCAEIIYKYQDQVRKADELISAFLEGLGVKWKNGDLQVKRDVDYVA